MHEEGYILFAHKALLLVPDLGDAARRVAGAILSHYNMKTGQCDPSIDRLAAMLGIDRATVMRATARLHERNLITRTRHGGGYHRTAYEPNFALFNSMVADWDTRMRSSGGSSGASNEAETDEPTVADVRPSRSQYCDFDSRNSATQTLRINSSNKHFERLPPRAQENRPPPPPAERSHGLGKGRGLKAQHPKPQVVRGMSHQQIAEDAAQRRIDVDLRAMGTAVYGFALEMLTEQIMATATAAEVKRRGAGALVVREALLAGAPAVGGRA